MEKIVSIGYFVSFREKTVTVAGLPTRRVYDVSQMCQMTHIFEIREKKNWCNDLLVLQLQLTVNTIQKRQNAIIWLKNCFLLYFTHSSRPPRRVYLRAGLRVKAITLGSGLWKRELLSFKRSNHYRFITRCLLAVTGSRLSGKIKRAIISVALKMP